MSMEEYLGGGRPTPPQMQVMHKGAWTYIPPHPVNEPCWMCQAPTMKGWRGVLLRALAAVL